MLAVIIHIIHTPDKSVLLNYLSTEYKQVQMCTTHELLYEGNIYLQINLVCFILKLVLGKREN